MNKKFLLSFLGLFITSGIANALIKSPDGRLVVNLNLDNDGHPVYSISYDGKQVINDSRLGLYADEADLSRFAELIPGSISSSDSYWSPVWGEFNSIRNHYNEIPFTLRTSDHKTVTVRFRVYDDGIGFRYEIPEQESVNYLTVRDELTQFNLSDNLTIFAIPGDYDTDERLYVKTHINDLGYKMDLPRHSESSLIPGIAIQTPLIAKRDDNKLYLNIHEAALIGYPAMALEVDTAAISLKSHLTPDKLGVKAYIQAPFNTPWRSLIIADNAPDILASQLIYNLNEECHINDTSWIKPMKFIGVWWEMFIGKNRTWAYSDKYNAKPGITDYHSLNPNGRHPANTQNVKRYIDFAAENGIDAVLVEGWNKGWEDWAGFKKNRQFSFTEPYPDFDIDSIQKYAEKKGVRMIMHHETAANAADYERQLDDAFKFMKKHNYNAVKTGYVGHVIPRSEYHSSQWMVDHYNHVIQKAADYHIMIDAHEAVRPTGISRTYPNLLAQESARGGEWESFGGNPPEHTTILPFTRLKGGPMDYTPGLFEMDLTKYGEGAQSKGLTTLTRQLALYITLPSPIQMACDLPENYQRFDDAFQFIRDVPIDWADSKWLEAEPGDFITVARKDKNSNDWYVGGITDENKRTALFSLDFLDPGIKYTATIYEDAKDAHYIYNPQKYNIRTMTVDSKTKLKQKIAPGGGFAIRLTPKNQ